MKRIEKVCIVVCCGENHLTLNVDVKGTNDNEALTKNKVYFPIGGIKENEKLEDSCKRICLQYGIEIDNIVKVSNSFFDYRHQELVIHFFKANQTNISSFDFCKNIKNPKYINTTKIIKKDIKDFLRYSIYKLLKESEKFFNLHCILVLYDIIDVKLE